MFWVTALLGLALGVAPWVLGYADHAAALWASVVLGLVVFLASVSGLIVRRTREHWEYWVLALATLAVIAAPVVLGYSSHAEPAWTALLLSAGLVMVNASQLLRMPQGVEQSR